MKIDKLIEIADKHLNDDLKNSIIRSENLYRARKCLESVNDVKNCTIFFTLFNTFILFDEVYCELNDLLEE